MSEAALRGRTIAITRSGDDAAEFVRLASRGGAAPLPLPTIELVARDGDPGAMAARFLDRVKKDDPDYTVFMSSKAAALLLGAGKEGGELWRAVANTAVVAVGPKTRAALEGRGIRVAHSPEKRYSSVGVGELFTMLHAAGKKAVIPRSGASTPFLRQLLEKIGLEVSEIHLYDVRASSAGAGQWGRFAGLLREGGVDAVIFTSASSARAFFEIMGRGRGRGEVLSMLGGTLPVAIGPFTAAELEGLGAEGVVSAGVHTVPGALDAAGAALAGSVS